MLLDVKVPQLSESVAEATLLAWHKKPGDRVEREENLADIETDKVVLETPAPVAGVLARILKEAGATVCSGEVIAQIETEAAVHQAEPPRAAAEPREATAMPAAQRLAAEEGVDLAAVPGTGRSGRVTKEDVLRAAGGAPPRAAQAPEARAAEPRPAAAGAREETRVPMSRLRARIAERLVEAQRTAAILTTFNEANLQPVLELRKRYRERFEKEHGVRLGLMSFFVKAAVHALRKYPIVNASLDGDDIVYHGYYDIGIAVAAPRGLVVPVLRDADRLSFAEIERAIADFGKRAEEGKLTIEELTGGTFSISNGGVFGSLLSTPILNPPQSAILGMHRIEERPVAEGGQVVVRPMMYLALSYDHRIIDGREAVLALAAIKEALEDPARLLLDV